MQKQDLSAQLEPQDFSGFLLNMIVKQVMEREWLRTRWTGVLLLKEIKLRPLLKWKECQRAVAKARNALIKLASRGLSKLQPLKLYSPLSLLCACCNSISVVMHPLGLQFNHPLLTKQHLRRFQMCFLQAVLQEMVGKVWSCWFSLMIKSF